jgi:uncharacterized protein (DUF934 family)
MSASITSSLTSRAPFRILSAQDHALDTPPTGVGRVLALANDADPLAADLSGVSRIELNFPKFTDGRAYSQAFLLRRRLGFTGEIRATGDVLIDQLVHMSRTGFDSAALREGVDAADAQRQFDRFSDFYQGDAVHTAPHFAAAN